MPEECHHLPSNNVNLIISTGAPLTNSFKRTDMNRNDTKNDLVFYLKANYTSVIALKGLWGTGKTYLWDEIKEELSSLNGNAHLYVSCFGLDSSEQIRLKLFQNSLGKAESSASWISRKSSDMISTLEIIGSKAMPSLEGTPTLIGSLGGLVQSTLIEGTLRERLIVIDDLERRGKNLRIESVMGLIDQLRHEKCKVLVILNDATMDEKELDEWRTLKEKCFDREITLTTTPAEAAEIGLGGINRNTYSASIKESLIKAQVTNIRVVQRISRIVQILFDDVTDPFGDIATSMVPAVVYLTALNFNAIPNGPGIEAFAENWPIWCANPSLKGKSEEFCNVISFGSKVNITHDIEFIHLVLCHIKSGHLFKQEFKEIFERKSKDSKLRAAMNSATEYVESIYLDPLMEDLDFINLAIRYVKSWQQLSAEKISPIALDLESRGRSDLAETLVGAWVERWRKTPQRWASHLYPIDSLHPLMKEAIEHSEQGIISGPTLLNSVMQIASGSWSSDQRNAVNNASPDEILKTLRSLKKDDFGQFIYFYKNEITNPPQRSDAESGFSAGIRKFLIAVEMQFDDKPQSRLSKLLHLHLDTIVQASSAPN